MGVDGSTLSGSVVATGIGTEETPWKTLGMERLCSNGTTHDNRYRITGRTARG